MKKPEEGIIKIDLKDKDEGGSIAFYTSNQEMLRIDPDGGFYVKGNLTETDREVYDTFKEWMEKVK